MTLKKGQPSLKVFRHFASETTSSSWISPEGEIVAVVDEHASEWPVKMSASETCSPEAKVAAQKSNFGDWEACWPYEFLKRGWIRHRGCGFSVWAMNKRTIGRIWDAAYKLNCDGPLLVEEWNDKGYPRHGQFKNSQEMLDAFDGVRKNRKHRGRK